MRARARRRTRACPDAESGRLALEANIGRSGPGRQRRGGAREGRSGGPRILRAYACECLHELEGWYPGPRSPTEVTRSPGGRLGSSRVHRRGRAGGFWVQAGTGASHGLRSLRPALPSAWRRLDHALPAASVQPGARGQPKQRGASSLPCFLYGFFDSSRAYMLIITKQHSTNTNWCVLLALNM